VTSSFAERFRDVRERIGPLVWGVDPAGGLLDQWGVGDTPDGLDRFVDVVLNAAVGAVGLIKPQAAFYERHGWRGIRSLTRLVQGARDQGLLVVLDAKRGDVGSTNEAYAEAYLGKGAPIEVDALTVHPYLGFEAMNAFVTRAHQSNACLLVVTRSTNPEGRLTQDSVSDSGTSVEARLLAAIGAANAALTGDDPGPVGAVVGIARNQAPLDYVTARGLFLVPGVGAQGTTPTDVAECFSSCQDRVMPSASRSLLQAGPDLARLRDDLLRLGEEFRVSLPC
jgi:orotidine-5'-phosphate decarboxylase